MSESEGILLVDKPKGRTSFSLVASLRKLTHIQKIGHAGTLDPLATGVMVMLIGRSYTRLSDTLLAQDKEYLATLQLGRSTDTYDAEGKTLEMSDKIPSRSEVEKALERFQGTQLQTPPMFSAKKIKGRKLYELARKGVTIERQPTQIELSTELISYQYPYLSLHISCSKGTYIRCIAHDLGLLLGCYAHLSELRRLRSGSFRIEQCVDWNRLTTPGFEISCYLCKS